MRSPERTLEIAAAAKRGISNPLWEKKRESSIGRGIREAIRTDDVDALGSEIRNLILIPPYDARVSLERYYQSLIYVVLRLMDGVDVRCEAHTANGRADLIVQYGHRLIVIELKLNGSAEDAIAQIEDRRYWEGSGLSGRDVYLLGINIDDSDNLSISWIGKRL